MTRCHPASLFLLASLLVCPACTDLNPEITGDADILAIGDSMLGYHQPDASIAHAAAAGLEMTVENAAWGGETILGEAENAVPLQYVPGSFRLLIANGGGNDIGENCSCSGDCDPVLEELISSDGQEGAIPELVRRATGDGAAVAWVGYIQPMADAVEFSTCGEELEQLAQRLRLLEESESDMLFLDGREVASGVEEALYEEDGFHPSTEGSRQVGQALAEAVVAAGLLGT